MLHMGWHFVLCMESDFVLRNGSQFVLCMGNQGQERGVVAGGSCSLVAVHRHGKPKALGSIPSSSTFLSSPFSAIPKVYGQ